ncbi:MAG: Ig family protein [Chlamydiales bacterium]|jgi:hypothetical protein|nr:Ig family protein [Chlamydiales bacterium]
MLLPIFEFVCVYIHDINTGAVYGIAIIATSISSGPGGGNWQYSVDGGISWLDIEPISNNNALLLTDSDFIRFNPDGHNGCSATISYKAWDQTHSSSGSKADTTVPGLSAFSNNIDTATIVVSSVNDAPILSPISPTLSPISEDDISNLGQAFDDFISSSIYDVDAGALMGIAVTATSVSSGTGYWEYSIDGGSSWLLFGTVLNTSARLLHTDDLIRFHPDGINGCIATITYRAWDQTSGAHNTVVDTTVNGTSTAFSIATDTATLIVSNSNDAPILNQIHPILTPITENQIGNGGQTISSIIGSSMDDDDTGALKGIAITATTITSGAGTGNWQYSIDGGTLWTNITAVSISNALLLKDTDLIRFEPDGMNSCTATITYQAWDQTISSAGSYIDVSISGGTTAFSSANGTATIAVMNVNDAPVLIAINPTLSQITEDQSGNIGQIVGSFIGSSISDVDSSALKGIAVIATAISSGIGTGEWQYSIDNGIIWTNFDGSPVSNTNALLLRDTDLIRFNPNGDNGCTATITYRAWDQTISAPGSSYDVSINGGSTAFSSGTDTATLVVDSINDAPILTVNAPSLITITENDIGNIGQTIASFAASSINDIDGGALKGIAITNAMINSGTGLGNWQYSVDNRASWIDILPVSATNALLLRITDFIRFNPDGKNGCIATITYRAWDQTSDTYGIKVDTSTNDGTTAFSTATDTATITVTSINDAPVLSPINPILNSITENDIHNGGQSITSIIGSSISDVDTGAIDGIAIMATSITSGSGRGDWQYSLDNGSSWLSIEPVSSTNALLLRDSDLIRFVPDGENGCSAKISYRAWDQSYSSARSKVDVSINGNDTAFSLAYDTATILVTDVNDPSLFSGTVAGQTINDDDTIKPFLSLVINDVDSSQVNHYTILLNNSTYGSLSGGTGTYDLTTGIYSFTGTASAAQSCFRDLIFIPTPYLLSPGSTFVTSFTLNSNDGAISDNHTSVIVSCVNHPSTISGGLLSRSVNDNHFIIPFANLTIIDHDYAQSNIYTIKLDNLNNGILSGGSGSYDIATGIYTFIGTAAQAEACFKSLIFIPTSNQVEVGSSTETRFTIESNDDADYHDLITVLAISVNDISVFSGTIPNQIVNDDSVIQPFFSVNITDLDYSHINTYTITLSTPTNGTLSGGLGSYNPSTGIYSFTGNAIAATNDFRSLNFIPAKNQVAVDDTVTTIFTLQSNDGATPDSDTTVIVKSVNDSSSILGFISPTPISSLSRLKVFETFTIQDVDPNQINIYRIIISNPKTGNFTNESILLGGFTFLNDGIYEFHGTASEAQAALRVLIFQPINNPSGGETSTLFTIESSDGGFFNINNQINIISQTLLIPTRSSTGDSSKGTGDALVLDKLGVRGIEFRTGKPVVLGPDLVGKFLANQKGASIGLTNILENPLHYTSNALGVYSIRQVVPIQTSDKALIKINQIAVLDRSQFKTINSSDLATTGNTIKSTATKKIPLYHRDTTKYLEKEQRLIETKSSGHIASEQIRFSIKIRNWLKNLFATHSK